MKEGLKGKALASLVFIALWLDGSFSPIILLPFLYVIMYAREGLATIGFSGSGLGKSTLLGLGVGLGVSVVYYPIFIHYLPRRAWEGASLSALFIDLVWYPFYEEVAYRGFFLGSFADRGEALSRRNIALNLIQALLFVAVHRNHISAGLSLLLIPVFALGFSMGLVFLMTRNIAGCAFGHSLLNGAAHLLQFFFMGR